MSNVADRILASWTKRISIAWRHSVEGIIETGRLINKAKAALPHGTFTAMIENDLPFGASTARRLMAVASDPRLTDQTHGHVLPPSWRTLYELTKLSDGEFSARISDGTIHPDMERRDVTAVGKERRRTQREADLAEQIQDLPERKYGVVVADCEWRFEPYSRVTGMDRAADNHYPTSDLEAIKQRPVWRLAADDCVLFLWATAPMLPQALEVMQAWGFAYKSHLIWLKDRIGTGYWLRNKHELLLIGTRGSIPAPAPGTQHPSVIAAPVGAHSAKPEVFLELIEGHFPTLPKIELNRRGPPRPGWDAWGAEATPTLIAAE